MKKFIWVALFLFAVPVFAEAAPTEVPAWLQLVMDYVVAIPGLGPVVLEVLKWLGVVAAVATALSTGLMVVAKALQGVGMALGLVAFAEKVDAIYQAVWPYLSFLSVYSSKKLAK